MLMQTLHIVSTEIVLDFEAALKLAAAIADNLAGESMLLSWYDRDRDLESPRGVSECHEGCPTKGFWDYGLNHGGELAVSFYDGRFVFCFQPLGMPE
jgi:hypothetical protein